MRAKCRIGFFWICFILLSAANAEVSNPPPPERIFGINLIQTGGGWPYDKGAIWLNAGTSFGLINFPAFGSSSSTPPLILSGDYSYSPHMAIGGYLGYFRITYTGWGALTQTRFESFQVGARWLFHGTDYLNDLWGLNLDIRQLDIYSGVSAGLDHRTFSYEKPDHSSFTSDPDGRTFLRLGIILGAKYIFRQRFGLYAEAGMGTFGAFNFGVSFKLKEKSLK